MQHKKPKAFNWRAMIRSHARRIWMWSPQRKEAIRNARVPSQRGFVACADCSKAMKENAKEKEYQVDHIIPAAEPSASIVNWTDFFERLYTNVSGLRVLCRECHELKTQSENKTRRAFRVKPKRSKCRLKDLNNNSMKHPSFKPLKKSGMKNSELVDSTTSKKARKVP